MYNNIDFFNYFFLQIFCAKLAQKTKNDLLHLKLIESEKMKKNQTNSASNFTICDEKDSNL